MNEGLVISASWNPLKRSMLATLPILGVEDPRAYIIDREPKTQPKGTKMNFEDLKNPELQAKLESASTPEDLFEIVKSEGIDLTPEQLQAISGGNEWADFWNKFSSSY